MIDKKFERWLLLNYPAYWELKPGTALLGFLAVAALGTFLGLVFPIDHIDTIVKLSEMGAVLGSLIGFGSAIGFGAWLWQMHRHRVERGFGRLSLGQDYMRLLGYFAFTMLLLVPTLAPNALIVFRMKKTFYGDFTKDVETMNRFLLCVEGDFMDAGSDTITINSLIGADPAIYVFSRQDMLNMRSDALLIKAGLEIAQKHNMPSANSLSADQILQALQRNDAHFLSSYDWESVRRRMNMFHSLLIDGGAAYYDYFPRWALFSFTAISFLASIFIYTIKKTGFKTFLLGGLIGHGVLSFILLSALVIAGISFAEKKQGFFPISSFFMLCSIATFIIILRRIRSGNTGGGMAFSMSNLTSLPVLATFFWWGMIYAHQQLYPEAGSIPFVTQLDSIVPYLSWGTLAGTAALYLLLIFPFAHKAGRRMMASPKRK